MLIPCLNQRDTRSLCLSAGSEIHSLSVAPVILIWWGCAPNTLEKKNSICFCFFHCDNLCVSEVIFHSTFDKDVFTEFYMIFSFSLALTAAAAHLNWVLPK